jgi:hypothetical protein
MVCKRKLGSFLLRLSSKKEMTTKVESTVRKAADPDIEVGLICADRDGNRVRIDRVDRIAGVVSYHFLNDELRVQEGIQDRSIMQFLAEGWYMAALGKSL